MHNLCQEVQQLGSGVEDLQRRLVALQLFQQQQAQGGDSSEAAVMRRLPLEPALAKLRWAMYG